MSFRALGVLCVLFVSSLAWTGKTEARPTGVQESPREAMIQVFKQLARSRLGRSLEAQAYQHWSLRTEQELMTRIRWGEVSRTDAVLTRTLDPVTGMEKRERRVTVYLKFNQTRDESVLDLAHELVHALSGPNWDPYDPTLTPAKYIHAVLEAQGGEVDALWTECQVAHELSRYRRVIGLDRCERYQTENQRTFSREKIRADFYRVGKYKERIFKSLGNEIQDLPLLSGEKAELYSSTGGAPYPWALLQEFEQITEVACRNTLQRLGSIHDAESDESAKDAHEETARFLSQRCHKETLSVAASQR